MTERPLFFHISPDGCGDARLARLFRRNGHAAVCHDNGRLAEDILFGKLEKGGTVRIGLDKEGDKLTFEIVESKSSPREETVEPVDA